MDHPSFLRAVFRRWWALISSAVLACVGFYALVANKSAPWTIGATELTAVLLFYIAVWGAWEDERRARLGAETRAEHGKPHFALEALDGEIHRFNPGPHFFFIRNCGQRTARNIRFDAIVSRSAIYAIRLDEIPSLATEDGRIGLTFRFGVDDDHVYQGSVMQLDNFFLDNPSKEAKMLFSVLIRFLDGTTERTERHTLVCEPQPKSGFTMKIAPTVST
jgi:hypothetical protein